MTILLICLIIVVMLPLLAKMPLAWAMNKEGGYNNAYPRSQQAQLKGFGARALAAHQNAFEAVILFTPAVLTAIVTNNIGDTVQWAAIIFVVMRLLYNLFYLLNYHILRSMSWVAAMACSFYMMLQAL